MKLIDPHCYSMALMLHWLLSNSDHLQSHFYFSTVLSGEVVFHCLGAEGIWPAAIWGLPIVMVCMECYHRILPLLCGHSGAAGITACYCTDIVLLRIISNLIVQLHRISSCIP